MIGKKAKNNVIGNWPNNAFFMISASFIGEIAVQPLGLILSFPLLYFYQTTIRLYAEGFFLCPSSEGQFFYASLSHSLSYVPKRRPMNLRSQVSVLSCHVYA